MHNRNGSKSTDQSSAQTETKQDWQPLGFSKPSTSIQMRKDSGITGTSLMDHLSQPSAITVQRKAGKGGDTASIHKAAAKGLQGTSQQLPHLGQIQQSFGKHSVEHVQAYVGGPAKDATESMGALAYASGNSVAFKESPTLHTAAHEAAHTVQQRAGIALKGGVGQVGDRYEHHADAVADRVVQGKSAEDLLDSFTGTEKGTKPAPVSATTQMLAVQFILDDPPWATANNWKLESSGNGGAVIVSFEGEDRKLVVKSGNDHEVFAARVAAQTGLTAPATRRATAEEASMLPGLLETNGCSDVGGAPYIIMEFLSGTENLGEMKRSGTKVTEEQVKALAQSLGKWLAFDIVIAEIDRFGVVSDTSPVNDINTANFMVNPAKPEDGLLGIDQIVTSGSGAKKSKQLYTDIMEESGMVMFTLGSMVLKVVNTDASLDEEDLGELLMHAAQAQFKVIEGVSKADIEALRGGLTVSDEAIAQVQGYVGE